MIHESKLMRMTTLGHFLNGWEFTYYPLVVSGRVPDPPPRPRPQPSLLPHPCQTCHSRSSSPHLPAPTTTTLHVTTPTLLLTTTLHVTTPTLLLTTTTLHLTTTLLLITTTLLLAPYNNNTAPYDNTALYQQQHCSLQQQHCSLQNIQPSVAVWFLSHRNYLILI